MLGLNTDDAITMGVSLVSKTDCSISSVALARAIIIKLMTIYDRIGDCIYCVVDEIKFWAEVLAAVMEWDEES